MTSRVSHTTIDCHNAYELSEWWKPVLGYADVDSLLFIEVPEAKQVKNRIHLDLRPTDRRRDDEIERVLGLGATEVADLRNADGTGWMVLADPQGNEFCILRSDAEVAEHEARQ
jgi:hypothetical protein